MKAKKQQKKKLRASNYLKIAVSILLILVSLISLASAVTINSVSTSPSQVVPGSTAKVSLSLENNLDEDVEDVQVVLDFSDKELPLAPYASSSEQSIDKIREDESESLSFTLIVLPEAASGVYKLPVKVSYTYKDLRVEKKDLISVVVNSQPQLKVSSEGVLVEGSERKVIVQVINYGLADVKFVSVETPKTISNGRIVAPYYSYIGDISSDDFDSVEYTIFLDSNSDVEELSLPLTIRYKDATNKDFIQNEVVVIPAYSLKEAQQQGIVTAPNYLLYGAIATIVLLFVLYRVVKKSRKKKIGVH